MRAAEDVLCGTSHRCNEADAAGVDYLEDYPEGACCAATIAHIFV
jgi:hypothetical protein